MLTGKNKCHHRSLLQDGFLRLQVHGPTRQLESIGAISARGPSRRAHSFPFVPLEALRPPARRDVCELIERLCSPSGQVELKVREAEGPAHGGQNAKEREH